MAYTVKELSSMAGVSIRTLHYYDELGLLTPAYVGSNGYRHYEEEQLLRLQHIMFFREFDVPLIDIRHLLDDPAVDRIEWLTSHRVELVKTVDRMQCLLQTLDNTIEKLKGERDMDHRELYEGFDPDKQKEYEKEVKARWGEDNPYVRESLAKTASWTKDDYDAAKARMADLHGRMKVALEQDEPADGPVMQALAAEHYRNICHFYTPTKEVFQGLGQMYVDDPRFRATYDSVHEGLAEYLRDAMDAYAGREL